MSLIAWLYWNPNRIAFKIPIVEHPIVWYGVFFVSGFFLAYLLMAQLLKRMLHDSVLAYSLSDRLVWYSVIGTIIGARLGHVFFYSWHYFRHHLLQIPCVWQGGLASHGGAIGVLLALWLFRVRTRKEVPELNFLALMDRVVIPTSLVGACIRIGNFWNQEILGTPSDLPWAVLFGSPFDGSELIPRHPVQLYEAGAYLIIFCLLFTLWWQRGEKGWRQGQLFGLFLVTLFSARFGLEFFKASLTPTTGIEMGQWLSLPFIVGGFFLLFTPNCNLIRGLN